MPLRETSSNQKGLQPIPSNLVVNLFVLFIILLNENQPIL